MSLRIAIFDDNKNIRDSIKMLLQTEPSFEVVGSFSNVFDCVDDVIECRPDIVLMDIDIRPISGIEAAEKICAETAARVIVIHIIFFLFFIAFFLSIM